MKGTKEKWEDVNGTHKERELNILHISDAHIQTRDSESIKDVVNKLIEDISKVQKEMQSNIDLICFTGDLIQQGSKALGENGEWELAEKIFINPILNELNLTSKEFIMVPGNHEVDTTKINSVIEKGLLVNSLDEINSNIQNIDLSYLKRIYYYYEKVKEMYDDVIEGKIGYAFKREINSLSVGIVCLDTAWRSSGKGECERGILYVSENQINELYKSIKNTDVKICLMHHPVEWLSGYETKEIEKKLNQFDIVLCGHVHENDNKVITRKKLNTIYNVAGKIYPLDFAYGKKIDGYNGYSIINISKVRSMCTIYLRSYFGKDRDCFDVAVNFSEDGKLEYNLNDNSQQHIMENEIVEGLKKFFLKASDVLSLINKIDAYSPENINSVYVPPVLCRSSEYNRTEHRGSYVSWEDIINKEENILFIGKKESGKTTILQNIGLEYLNGFYRQNKIPVYIDMRNLPSRGDVLLKSAVHFIVDNVEKNTNVNWNKVEKLINEGRCIFLVDNLDISNEKQVDLVREFSQKNNQNRYLITLQEEFFYFFDIKRLSNLGEKFEKIYIHSFRKNQIRELVTKWSDGKNSATDISQMVEKIYRYCNQINFAKTPFNISIFMVLWDFNANFIPQNEAYVMENYLEIVLEKLSLDAGDRKVYGFHIKQDFMSKVAYQMFSKGQQYLNEIEFFEFVGEYHKTKGYKVEDTKFDKIFFEKNILCQSGDIVFFNHTSVQEFYLALYAKNNQTFLEYMLKKGNRTSFQNEICFYSGLINDCSDLLEGISESILEEIYEDMDIIDELNRIEIMIDFKLNKEEIYEKIYMNRLSQNEIDDLNDYTIECKNELNQETFECIAEEQKEQESQEEQTEDFMSLLKMYGSVLKNAELLDNKDKIYHLENYITAMNILLGLILQVWKDIVNNMDRKELEEIRREIGEDEVGENEIWLNLEKNKEKLYDIFQLIAPIMMQQIISENVGTPKLEMAINEIILHKENEPFEKIMLSLLKCDFGIGSIKGNLLKIIREEKSDSILKIIQMKLIYYIQMRVWGADIKKENEILDLIIEIESKFQGEKGEEVQKGYRSQLSSNRRHLLDDLRKTGTYT